MSSVQRLGERVLQDLSALCPDMYKNPREKLATLVAVAVDARSCNLMEWAARLPIASEKTNSRYAWVERFLSADTVQENHIMQPLARQVLALAGANDQTIIINLDQTSIGDLHGIAMVSVRICDRGLPLFWKTEQTAGNLPTSDYISLLDKVAKLLPEGAKVLLMADRFFDAGCLIKHCKTNGWGWRIRLKSNINVQHEGGEIRLSEMEKLGLNALTDAQLTSGEITNIGYLHEAGHEGAWFVAMNDSPSVTTTKDYGLRWGIEAMFSDYKTRGFGLEDTHLERSDRLSKLLLVLAVAMHLAVITGIAVKKNSSPQEV
jgi:hypothetical protein